MIRSTEPVASAIPARKFQPLPTWVYVALDFVPHGLFELGAALPEVVAATITAAAIAGRLKGVVTETSSSSARPTGRDVAYLFGVYHSGRSSKLHATSG